METNAIDLLESLQSHKSGLSGGIEFELLRDLLDAELIMVGGGAGEVVLG